MALVTKTGGFYRRIEKGIHFFFCFVFRYLDNSVCFGRMGFFFSTFLSFFVSFLFCFCACFCFLCLLLSSHNTSCLFPPLPYHYTFLFLSGSLSLCFFVVFEMMGLAVGCFLFLSTG